MRSNNISKKYNIIFLSNAIAGIASFQSNLINYFSKKKINTILIDANNETVINLNSKLFNKFYKCNILKEFFKTLKILKKINKIDKKKENIFIISNTTVHALYFLLIKLFIRNSKFIVVYHSHIYSLNFIQLSAGMISSLLSLFSFYSIYVSKFTKKWWNIYFPLTKLGNQKVIYNYIEIPKKIRKKNLKSLKIGFIGRFEKEKGINQFLKIANNLSNKNLKFFVFGDGSIKIKKNQNKNIKIFRWTKKEFMYQKIDVLFVTSKIENCPLSVIEAKSYGIPTVTISKGGIKEIIRNRRDGLILNKKSSLEEIKNKILSLKKNYNFYKKNCLENSTNLELDNYKKFLNLF